MVTNYILIGTNKSPLDTAELHQITIVRGFCRGKYGNDGSGVVAISLRYCGGCPIR
jgi:hypothetical protein